MIEEEEEVEDKQRKENDDKSSVSCPFSCHQHSEMLPRRPGLNPATGFFYCYDLSG